jgi:hypothetical protein
VTAESRRRPLASEDQMPRGSVGNRPTTKRCSATRVYIDIDHTMVGEDNSVRPGVESTLSHLKNVGHELYAWSGDTTRKGLLQERGLLRLFQDVSLKPTSSYRQRARELCRGREPDFVVDDHAQVVRMFGGVHLAPYYGAEHADQTFILVASAVELHVSASRQNREDDLWIYTVNSDRELGAKRICDNRVSEVEVHRVEAGGLT